MTNQNSSAGGKNTGYIIANDRANDRQPHYRGKVTVEGKEFWVSMWKKEPRDGKEMLSIELTDPATLPPRPGQQAQGQRAQQGGQNAPRPPAQQSSAPAPAAAQAATPPGEDKAFDDIFGGDGNQW